MYKFYHTVWVIKIFKNEKNQNSDHKTYWLKIRIILVFSDNECKINAKMELQWSNSLIQERMRDKRKVNITILLHSQEMDGMTV